MVKTVMYEHYGEPEVLTMHEVEPPEPGDGQVRVSVRAAGINPMDAKIRRGDLQEAMPATFPVSPGAEVAGVVDEVGVGMTRLRVGDEVVGMTDGGAGGYSEHALGSLMFPKPASLSWAEAAAVPTVAGTAHRILNEAGLEPGRTVLVHGAAGSVGSVVVQLAVARGLTVIGTARDEDLTYVAELGATAVRYGYGSLERVRSAAPNGADFVLDTSGAGVLPDSIELMGGTGGILTIADMGAFGLGVHFSAGDPDDTSPGQLPELITAAGRGEFHVRVWRTFALADAAEAHRALEDHTARGKIVLLP